MTGAVGADPWSTLELTPGRDLTVSVRLVVRFDFAVDEGVVGVETDGREAKGVVVGVADPLNPDQNESYVRVEEGKPAVVPLPPVALALSPAVEDEPFPSVLASAVLWLLLVLSFFPRRQGDAEPDLDRGLC